MHQREGSDSERKMAAASDEEVAKEMIKIFLEEMNPLPGRISELLQQHRGRRRSAADDHELRCWKFIQVELSGIVASLSQIHSLAELGPYYVGQNFRKCMSNFSSLTSDFEWHLRTIEQASLRGCHAQLRRAAARCFPRLPLPDLFEMYDSLDTLYTVAESPWRYMHLLQDEDGDRNSRTSSSYSVDAGGNIFLVGIEGTLRNKKLRWFMADQEDNKTCKVISMVGPIGVGKTALAMEVYRQLQQIGGGHYFECCATAKVSRRPDMKELLKHILSQIDKPASLAREASVKRSQITTQADEEHKLLAGNINQCLQGKRYLIVVDDIWKESDWNIIKNAFPQNSPGSRIIITTQLRSVAQSCCSYSGGLVHEVKPLSQKDSERLLFREAFCSEDGCPLENLKQVCDGILKRCEGIPLFITGMAEWLQEQQKVQHTPINCSMEIVPKLPGQFELALTTIHNDLNCHLKLMLMYVNMFPEGHTFYKDSLFRKWCLRTYIYMGPYSFIAGPYYHLGSYHDGTELFSGLFDRNVVTRVAATRGNTSQEEENCHWQVNYFMRQFIASKSADMGFLHTSGTFTPVVAEGGKTLRRLSLHQPDPELPTLLGGMDLSHTRSLVISGKVDGIPLDKFSFLVVLDLEGWQCVKQEDLLRICKMFLLRRLILRNTGVSKLPPEIKDLQHLWTLDISHTQISELPSQLYELSRLKMLDLRSTRVRRLPEQIWKLHNLQYLLVGGAGVPEGIGRLEDLRSLATVDLSQCSPSLVEALGGIASLEVLAITWSFHQCTDRRFREALRWAIMELKKLVSLTIHCGLGCSMDFLDSRPGRFAPLHKFKVSGGRFASLPQWFGELWCLTFIEITVCTLEPEHLSILGDMPELECLVLGLHFLPEAAIVIDGFGFQKLERLSVCCRVPWLTFTQGAMPALTYLELKIAGSPASQQSVPSGISNLWSLSEVAICYHANYSNSPSVKMTVEAVRKQVAHHFNPINLFINGILEEYVEEVEEDSARATVTGSQTEIQIEG